MLNAESDARKTVKSRFLRGAAGLIVYVNQMGLEEFAFEAVILRYPQLFSKEAVAKSEERLGTWRKI
jgi:hypothetical protein